MNSAFIPNGPSGPTNVRNSSLQYDEFIVYDVAQINIKYLLVMDFKYKNSARQ